MVLHKRHLPKLLPKTSSNDNAKRKDIFKTILDLAKKRRKRICFPESDDPRILQAVNYLAKKDIVTPILLGDPESITAQLKKNKLTHKNIQIISSTNKEFDFSQQLYELRKKKGLSLQGARALLEQPMYYATMLLKNGHIDGIVYGATHPSSETYRPALQIIKTVPEIKTASSYFIEVVDGRTLFYADCAFNIDPDAKQLCDIAYATAQSVKALGYTPKVAFLSFSTKGSGEHEMLGKIRVANMLLKRKDKSIICDGELQFDAAIIPQIAKSKAPGSPIQGDANILVFPDLNAGNISYKITQRLAHARVIGPISQGLRLPVNDLSRGCTVEEIIEVAAMTAIQAHEAVQKNKAATKKKR